MSTSERLIAPQAPTHAFPTSHVAVRGTKMLSLCSGHIHQEKDSVTEPDM